MVSELVVYNRRSTHMAEAVEEESTARSATKEMNRSEVEVKKYNTDPLSLHGVDNPNSILCGVTLVGTNYFSWIKSIRLALQAKVKLGFLDGSCPKPEDPHAAAQWMVVDAMVRSWILNTISKEIRVYFEGTMTTQDLWQEIKARFEENNGPTIYGLARDISTIQQGNLGAEAYYSKIKLYWEEMSGLNPLVTCECDGTETQKCFGCRVVRKVVKSDEQTKLLQFLLSLNESYETVKDQILNQDPFPTVYKAFTMVLNIEKKRSINLLYHSQQAAMMLKEEAEVTYKLNATTDSKQALLEKKKNVWCKHCNMKGHSKEGCFKLVGYPDWWKQPKERKKFHNQTHVNMANSPLDIGQNADGPTLEDFNIFKTYWNTMKNNKGSSSNFSAGP